MLDSTKKPLIVAIDLDGTLLPETKRIPILTKLFFRKLNKNPNVKIVLASGRPNLAVAKYAKILGSKAPIVCFNGAIACSAYDPSFPVFVRKFKKENVREIFSDGLRLNVIENMLVEDESNTWLFKKDKYLEKFFWVEGSHIHYGEISKTLHLDPLTVVFKLTESENLVEKLDKIIGKYHDLSYRLWRNGRYAEIFQEGSSKAEALRHVADFYNVDMKDVVAFGDASNDIEMLREVGTGVCMVNGHERAKAAGNRVSVASCEHEGVRKTLKIILKERGYV